MIVFYFQWVNEKLEVANKSSRIFGFQVCGIRRRMVNTEEKAKVVAPAAWGIELIQFLAAHRYFAPG